MNKVSIIQSYYDDWDMLKQVKELYDPYMDLYDFIIVDDASPIRPLQAEDVPGWSLYRITKDIGFNNEGAKNLGMHVTETKWNLLLDMDHPVLPETLDILNEYVDNCDPLTAYYPVRKHDKKSINSILITKDMFWDCNGYDETYTGYYGYDNTLQTVIKKKYSQEFKHDLLLGFIKGHRPSLTSRKEKTRQQNLFKEMRRKVKAGELEGTDERLRFPWEKVQ